MYARMTVGSRGFWVYHKNKNRTRNDQIRAVLVISDHLQGQFMELTRFCLIFWKRVHKRSELTHFKIAVFSLFSSLKILKHGSCKTDFKKIIKNFFDILELTHLCKTGQIGRPLTHWDAAFSALFCINALTPGFTLWSKWTKRVFLYFFRKTCIFSCFRLQFHDVFDYFAHFRWNSSPGPVFFGVFGRFLTPKIRWSTSEKAGHENQWMFLALDLGPWYSGANLSEGG